jgi:group I intron endonuclease
MINQVNLKMYIGKTIYPEDRFDQHLRAARNNTSNMVIHKAIRKYGPQCFHFEILETYSTEEESLAGEKYWISIYDTMVGSKSGGYNMTEGGENASPCEELREILSAKTKEYFSIPGNREKQSEAIKAYFQTPGAKERQSQLISAYANSPEGKIAYSEKNKEILCITWVKGKS